MPRGDPDPRTDLIAPEELGAQLREGAARYNGGHFWHAHEAWEKAWHRLRADGRQDEADYVQAMVWVTASFENLRRGKAEGFRRQLAKALARLEALRGRGAALGLADEDGWLAALRDIERGAAGIHALGDLAGGAPPLRLRG